jgi:hypothetical protein
MNDGETVDYMYQCLTTLVVTMRDIGASYADEK